MPIPGSGTWLPGRNPVRTGSRFLKKPLVVLLQPIEPSSKFRLSGAKVSVNFILDMTRQ
jgi:hypothetical protein